MSYWRTDREFVKIDLLKRNVDDLTLDVMMCYYDWLKTYKYNHIYQGSLLPNILQFYRSDWNNFKHIVNKVNYKSVLTEYKFSWAEYVDKNKHKDPDDKPDPHEPQTNIVPWIILAFGITLIIAGN